MKKCVGVAALLLMSSPLTGAWCGSGPASIPDNGASSIWWSVDVDLPQDHLVVDLSVQVQLQHPWVGDLIIDLQSPEGQRVRLLDRPGMPDGGWIGPWGCGGDHIDVVFNDSGSEAAETTCTQFDVPVIAGVKRPYEPLSGFHSLRASGLWRVEIQDASPIDAGQMQTACMVLTTSPDCNENGVPDVTDIAEGASQDLNQDGVPDECECPADLDGDGSVDVNDLLDLIGQFGLPGEGDLDGSGLVDADDLLSLLGSWGACE